MRSFRNADGRRPTPVRTAALSALTLASLVGAGAAFGRDPVPLADRRSDAAAAETSNAAARRRFQGDRFGLALPWGVFALIGKGAWVMERDKLPVSEYEKLPPRFNPTEFDA
jgi:alpha-L-fucosidase